MRLECKVFPENARKHHFMKVRGRNPQLRSVQNSTPPFPVFVGASVLEKINRKQLMPKKINRFDLSDNGHLQKRSSGFLHKAPTVFDGRFSKTTGTFATPGGPTTAHVVVGVVHALLDCGRAYLNYLESRQATRRMEIWSDTVIQEARETTRRMEIQAAAMVELAKEHAREVELNAQAAQAEVRDRRDSRDAKMRVVTELMDIRREYEAQFLGSLGECRGNLSVEERMFLNSKRNVIQQRLRDLDAALASMCANL
jgi:hypothetical protein